MRPQDILRYRRAMGLTKRDAGAVFLMKADTWSRMERGIAYRHAGAWLRFGMAWTILYGIEKPYTTDQMPEAFKSIRKMYKLSSIEMGDILDINYHTVKKIEAASEDRHIKHAAKYSYALAWIRMYGLRQPFPIVQVTEGIPICPMCGR